MNPTQLSCYQGTRSLVKATALSVVLLLTLNFNLSAQDLPPIPGGDPGTPREPTPEELEAQRLAQEELWRKNRELVAPILHIAPAPAPVDPAVKQRLIEAELLQREQAREAEEQRKQMVLNRAAVVGARQRETRERAEALARALGYRLRSESKDGSGVSVDLIGGRLGVRTSYNVNAAKTIATDKARTNVQGGFEITGQGRILGLWDAGVAGTNHVEFTNGGTPRVIWRDSTNLFDPSGHPTIMAGVMAAAGVDADAQGMAYEAKVMAYNYDQDYEEMATASVTDEVKLSNHSYGFEMGWGFGPVWYGSSNSVEDIMFSAYTEQSYEMDQIAYDDPHYLAVWAAGNGRNNVDMSGQNHQHIDEPGLHTDSHNANDANSGGYGTLNFLATGKNSLAVGAVGDLPNGWQGATSVVMTSFSFWGPTDDGRIKPDIVANGTTVYSPTMTSGGTLTYTTGSGTSSAAASVTGTLGLLRQRFAQMGYNPTAATLAGLLIHTADDAGQPGPDYQFGFGLVNADRAARRIMENFLTYNSVQSITNSPLVDGHLLEGVLENSQTHDIAVYKSSAPLKVTLRWHEPPGYYGSVAGQLNPTNHMLVNNLDVAVIHPGTTTNYPYVLSRSAPSAAATTGTNWVDNTEQVVEPGSGTGLRIIRVSHRGTLVNAPVGGSTTNQPYSLWVDGHDVTGKPAIFLQTQTSSNTVAVAWYAEVNQDYKVQYIDEVDAPSTAWTDATGTITATSPLVAAEVNYSPSVPQRFYRIVYVP